MIDLDGSGWCGYGWGVCWALRTSWQRSLALVELRAARWCRMDDGGSNMGAVEGDVDGSGGGWSS